MEHLSPQSGDKASSPDVNPQSIATTIVEELRSQQPTPATWLVLHELTYYALTHVNESHHPWQLTEPDTPEEQATVAAYQQLVSQVPPDQRALITSFTTTLDGLKFQGQCPSNSANRLTALQCIYYQLSQQPESTTTETTETSPSVVYYNTA